jgi:hypothetical protein
MAGTSNADIEDLMYAGLDADLSSMATEHQADMDAKAVAQAGRDAKKAEVEEAAKREAVAEDQRLNELISAPLPGVNGNAGPGSNAAMESVTLVSKASRKRKEREAMTQEQRDAEDEEKARRAQKSKETKAKNKARKEREVRKANEPPKKQLRPIEEIEEALDVALGALDRARREAMDKGTDSLAVSLQKLAEDVAELQEELRLTGKERMARAVAAGADKLDEYVPTGRLWWPKDMWLPADLKIADEDDVRYVNVQARHKMSSLEAEGLAGTDLHKCVSKTYQEMRADLRRRLEATKGFKKMAREEAKKNAMSARQQRAIDDFDNWEKWLVSASDRKWWNEEGHFRAMNKHYPNANVCKPAEVDEMAPLIEAQVETEEM